MQATLPSCDEAQMRRCVRELVALPSLPAALGMRDMVEGVADVLLGGLCVEWLYVRLGGPGEETLEVARLGPRQDANGQTREIGRVLAAGSGFDDGSLPPTIPNPLGGAEVCLAVASFDSDGERGLVVAASRRPGFPTEAERLLLDVAAGQLAVGVQLQRARKELAERRRRHEALSRSERTFRRLLETLPAGAYTCDPDGLITYFNPHAVRLWGRAPKPNDPVDRFCGSFELYSREGVPIAHDQCWMALALKTGQEYIRQEIAIQRPDGTRIAVLAHAAPIHDEAGQLLGAVNILVDVTEQKRIEKALLDADGRKDEFLATLAHELRNPLAPIRNSLHLLRMSGGPGVEQVRVMLERQVNHMVRLVDDLLEVARITRGKIELRRERVELADVVCGAVETSRPLIEAGRHHLALVLPGRPLVLDADPVRLSQVIANLLNNAAKYTPAGGQIGLTLGCEDDQAVVSVRDTGMGIPADMLPQVFDMFAQVDRTLDRAQGGLGIGLSLARNLVLLHNGTIEARSAGPGQGSEFVVRLPLAPERGSGVEPGPSAEDWSSKVIAARRILVVDDHRDAADSLGLLLQFLGNDVRIAHDGPEALEAVRAYRPGIVLLDIGMPGMDGYEVARRLRAQPELEGLALVALTGWGQEEDRRRSCAAGFDHHLVKPVDLPALQALLASLAPGQGPLTTAAADFLAGSHGA